MIDTNSNDREDDLPQAADLSGRGVRAEPDPRDVLRPNQMLAITALLDGLTVAAAAKFAGVRRQTINRWRREDPHFVAALRRSQQELLARTRSLITAAAETAARSLIASVEDDGRLAYRLLRDLGMIENHALPTPSLPGFPPDEPAPSEANLPTEFALDEILKQRYGGEE